MNWGTSNIERRTLNVEVNGFGANFTLSPGDRVNLWNTFGCSQMGDSIPLWNSCGGCL
jgi:hypothetical protein